MILLIDNYDSFVHNLARYLTRLGAETIVVRNDAISVNWIRNHPVEAIVLSPGPCTPTEAGASLEIVREFWQTLPMLGVCLGHQTIAAAFGARIVRAATPMHGRTSDIQHSASGDFAGLPNPLTVARYHSLIVEESTLPTDFRPTAYTHDGMLMAFEHRNRPIVGWQFHPESILTQHGYELLARFFARAGIAPAKPLPTLASERRTSELHTVSWTDRPITF